MAPAKKAATKATAAASKTASSTSAAGRVAKAKPSSSSKADKAAATAVATAPAVKRRSARVGVQGSADAPVKNMVGAESAAKEVAGKEAESASASGSAEDSDEALDEAEIIQGFSDVSGSDDEANSSDEDDDDNDVEAGKNASILTVKLPNAKDDHSVKQRLDKVAKRKMANKSVEIPATLYMGRLPRGFFEEQLRSYLSQFGDVRRLRVSRNRKTGKPKHYAFVEFVDRDVAAIVQETMNNYLIDGHLLQVKEVPKDKIHPKLWIGANRKYRAVPVDRVERVRRNQPKTAEQQAKHDAKLLKRQEAKREQLKASGIDYDFDGYKVQV